MRRLWVALAAVSLALTAGGAALTAGGRLQSVFYRGEPIPPAPPQPRPRPPPLRGLERLNAIMGRGPPPQTPPYPTDIVFSPERGGVGQDSPVGTPILSIEVVMSDGSVYQGPLGFGPPYFDADGCVGLQGHQLILACDGLDDVSVMRVSVTTDPQ